MPTLRISSAIAPLLVLALTGCGNLVSAARDRDAAAVAKLLAKGADPNEPDGDTTPLCEAVTQNDAKIAELLIKAGAKVERGCSGGSVLCSAPADVTKVLLAHGADPNGSCGQWSESVLEEALRLDHPERVRALIAGGADVLGKSTASGWTVLETFILTHGRDYQVASDGVACGDALFEAVADKLGAAKAKELANFRVGDVALLGYAGRLDPAIVELLLRHGADPNALSPLDLDGVRAEVTPLVRMHIGFYDAPAAEAPMVKLLVAHGGRVEIKLPAGVTRETFLAKLEASREELRKREQERREEAAEAEREREEEDAEEEREERARNRARGQAMMEALAGGGGQGGQTNQNPTADHSFEDRMRQLAQQAPASPPQGGGASGGGSSSGIVVDTSPAAQPPAAPPPGEAKNTPAPPAAPAPPAPKCREEPAVMKVFGQARSVSAAEERAREDGAHQCGPFGGVSSIGGLSCAPLGGETGLFTCRGKATCAKTRSVCEHTGGSATQQ